MGDVKEAPDMIKTAAGWRMAFSAGFLDGDSGRPRLVALRSYVVGWKVGRIFAWLRSKMVA